MKLKKTLLACLILALILALLAGCGSKNDPAPAADSETPAQQNETQEPANDAESAQEAEAAAETETETETEPEAEAVNPYAWLGLEDIPKCPYLDQLSTNNYIQVYDTYVLGVKAEVTDACEGLKSYQKNGANLTYNLEGMIYSVNPDSKMYAVYDMTSAIEDAKASMEAAISSGTNTKGRVFQGTGKGTVPIYSDEAGDSAEYEYYEYLTGDADSSSVLERFFLRDGDVFAIYTKTHAGESDLESTNVIKSISGDIPAEIFVLPDLTDDTKIN